MPRKSRPGLSPFTMLGAAERAPDARADDARPAPGHSDTIGRRVEALSLDGLWLEHQPRELVPEDRLRALIDAGEAHPRALLAVLLVEAEADAYFAAVLTALRGLAASIAAQGILQPIEVARLPDGRAVVRDGHRRCLAALLAGLEIVPAIEIAEPGDVEAAAQALVLNLQREDLTALEKSAALLRLTVLVGRELAADHGLDPALVTAESVAGLESAAGPAADAPPVQSTTADRTFPPPDPTDVQSTTVDRTAAPSKAAAPPGVRTVPIQSTTVDRTLPAADPSPIQSTVVDRTAPAARSGVQSTTVDRTPDQATAADATGHSPSPSGATTTLTGLPRALAAAVRDRVCSVTGLSRQYYYALLALNRLTAEARSAGRGLTENRLRPVVAVPPARQLLVLAFAERHQLPDRELRSLCQVMRAGDEDQVQRVMARLRRDEQQPRARPSWQGLLHAVPADWPPRLTALAAEVAALPDRPRASRLAEMAAQVPRLRALADGLQALLDAQAARPPDADAPDAEAASDWDDAPAQEAAPPPPPARPARIARQRRP